MRAEHTNVVTWWEAVGAGKRLRKKISSFGNVPTV